MYKNTEHITEIVDFGSNGEGIAKPCGFTVFVPSAVKGDVVKILIVKENKHFGYGKLLEIISPSPIREEPQCAVFPKCGGCTMQGISYAAQIEFKERKVLEALKRIGSFSDARITSVTESKPFYNYRNKAQFPVVQTEDGIVAGFYAPRSHRVVASSSCALQKEESNALCAAVIKWANENGVVAYDEFTKKGSLRKICIRAGKKESVLVLVTALPLSNLDILAKEIKERFPYVKGLVQNFNSSPSNNIYGEKDEVIFGVPHIFDTVGTIKYKVHYKSFYQVNPYTTKLLYEKALALADCNGNKTVFDLYCGTGTISLFLAQKAKEVIGIEISKEAVENAKENAALNNIKNARFFCGEAEEVAPLLIKDGLTADSVVLDPPRKGCDTKLLDSIGKMNPERIVYVSCDAATMARDAKLLSAYGYKLEEVHLFDQFPQTSHTECVILMTKQK